MMQILRARATLALLVVSLMIGCSGGAVWAPGGMLFEGDDVIRLKTTTTRTQEATMDRVVRTLEDAHFRIGTIDRSSGYLRTEIREINDTRGLRLNVLVTDSAVVELAAQKTDLQRRDRAWRRVTWRQSASRRNEAWSMMTTVAQQMGTIQSYEEDPEYDTIACGGRRCSADTVCQGNVCRSENQQQASASRNHLPFSDEPEKPASEEAPQEPARQEAPQHRPLPSETQPPSADEYAAEGTNEAYVGRVIFEQTNQNRRAHDRPPLERDAMLRRIACRHNKDMLAHDYMSHEDSDGRQPADRVAREHRRLIGSTGENVYSQSGVDVDANSSRRSLERLGTSIVEGWMQSPGHRKNILANSFTHLGTCYTRDQDRGRATQVFAQVTAYLDRPLPWTMSPGDSLSTTVTPVDRRGSLVQYAFVSPDESLQKTLERAIEGQTAQRFTGMLYLPPTAGLYESRFIFRDTQGRFWIRFGPRVTVE